jgi:GPH family glycoside/pentoside/hexuronide:cation symporter
MEDTELEIKHPKRIMASFAFGTFMNEFLWMAFSAFAFFFYEGEIGLDVVMVGLAFIIYGIWNAINDPLIGFLTDRPFKFTKKWGRRFPWMVIGGIPWVLSYILIFIPPNVNPNTSQGAWVLFAWLLLSLCLFDTFCSMHWVNYSSLFPDKFRSSEERRTANGFNILIGVIGTVSGAVIPPLFIVFGNLQSYIIQAGVVFLVAVIALSISIPGSRDEKAYVNRYLDNYNKQTTKTSFFQTLKTSLHQKNFIVYIIIILSYQIMIRSMTASIPYIAKFILKLEASVITIIMGSFLISVLISTPFWVKLAHRINDNRKVMLITGTLLIIFTIPLIFVNTLEGFVIAMVIWGLVLGGFWAMQMVCLADVIDESVVKTCKREEGIYNGVNTFFSRLAIIAQAISFAIVHTLTGFVEGSDTQTPLAIRGIQIHFAVVPLFALLIGMIIFWRWYDITPDRVKANQLKIKEMCL